MDEAGGLSLSNMHAERVFDLEGFRLGSSIHTIQSLKELGICHEPRSLWWLGKKLSLLIVLTLVDGGQGNKLRHTIGKLTDTR